jgi:pyruvate dehydrogenase E2 component (dihydrolipoyllysine-residue acetyltransferase)
VSEITETGTAKGDVSVVEPSRVQQVLARRVAEAKATVPEHVLVAEVDLEAAVATGVPAIDLVVKACALALRDVPQANASYKDGKYERYSRINVGVAVTGQDAIVVPTIFDADRKAPAEIGAEREALTAKVRAGEITAAEVGNATFTIHDQGAGGADAATAVIQAPQAATLALGAVAPRVIARDGAPVVRHTAIATLTCDHRILFGAEATRFLARVRGRLERPADLLG